MKFDSPNKSNIESNIGTELNQIQPLYVKFLNNYHLVQVALLKAITFHFFKND